ncbi:heparan-alpha-glucosaminide N-acetyltransferase domain-containing protein [Vibrio taketomensis]|uniref:heparan-alpha-glucosaminide N-acetyltransferase domain-containing protein n=1 Tax=Vibrio taketomensis TaxID=2572923 RepID=UPI00138A34F4
MHKNRLVELDALRGIAALSVVLYHFFYRYDEIYGHKNLSVDWSFSGNLAFTCFYSEWFCYLLDNKSYRTPNGFCCVTFFTTISNILGGCIDYIHNCVLFWLEGARSLI